MNEEGHLGDGCYVSGDGQQLRLRAPREDCDHIIYLDLQLVSGNQSAHATWEGIMLKFSLVVTAVTSVLVTLAMGYAVAQKVPPELPQAIICWNNQTKTWVVGNLSTIKEDGTATYLGTGTRISATVNAKGVVEPPSNRPANLDCFGKTLDQLRAMDRLNEFQRTR
jgi:hypothetical protein